MDQKKLRIWAIFWFLPNPKNNSRPNYNGSIFPRVANVQIPFTVGINLVCSLSFSRSLNASYLEMDG